MHCRILLTSHNGTQQAISMHCGLHHASSHHRAGSSITHVQWHSAHYLDAPWHLVPIHNRIHCAEQRWHLTCSRDSLWQRTGQAFTMAANTLTRCNVASNMSADFRVALNRPTSGTYWQWNPNPLADSMHNGIQQFNSIHYSDEHVF